MVSAAHHVCFEQLKALTQGVCHVKDPNKGAICGGKNEVQRTRARGDLCAALNTPFRLSTHLLLSINIQRVMGSGADLIHSPSLTVQALQRMLEILCRNILHFRGLFQFDATTSLLPPSDTFRMIRCLASLLSDDI